MPTELTVVGYLYDADDDPVRHLTVCKIVARAETPVPDFEYPAFRVRFGDGHERVVYASELSPWFPT